MSGAKKTSTAFDEQANAKIQRKFDLVFSEKTTSSTSSKNSGDSINFNNDEIDIQFGSGSEDEFVMDENTKSKNTNINLDLSSDDETPAVPSSKAPAVDLNDDGLDFSLNFDLEASSEAVSNTVETKSDQDDFGGFTLDDSDVADSKPEFDEATKKTVMISSADFQEAKVEEFSLEKTGSHNAGSADNMSNEESRASIESTIKDILKPKLENTKDIDIKDLDATSSSALDEIEDSELNFRENTPSKGFDLAEISDEDFAIESTTVKKADPPPVTNFSATSGDSTGEFDISNMSDDSEIFNADIDEPSFEAPQSSTQASSTVVTPAQTVVSKTETLFEAPPSMGMGGTNITSEEGMRFQATIRALREEREVMLQQIKDLKTDSKELEQDNLTLKANLDEAKIEITILRKRHMVELEDIKYRLTMSEEKKAMADEKARQADMQRSKLEQKVRIDLNQVKQREKELESKLELLSMDVDSQVQSRDQKILELRRKIDALEFNMENASIKEQKSLDDKRKLEDRLNKIMKTLRNSIKNLEDDIDHAQVDDDHQKDKN